MDELEVPRPDEHRDDRHATGDQDLGLVGVERRRGHDVVVEALQPVWQVVEQGALGLDPREGVDEPFRVVAGVCIGALGEQDTDERSGPFSFRGRGKRGGRQLVRGEPGMGGASQHLGHDACQRLRPASFGWAVRNVGPRAVTTGHVPRVGESAIDGPDGIRVDPQGGTELAVQKQG